MADKVKKIEAVKGMVDVLPPDSNFWIAVEGKARDVFSAYGYHEIRTPIVEPTDLFVRGVGETSAIVEKEMYSFVDQGGDSLTLRPEGTASVVRAYIESGAAATEPVARYYYMGPMFRRERPQKGRQRQFYQIGAELLGFDSPVADAEVIAMADHFLKDAGADDVVLELNSIGCRQCRPSFNQAMTSFLSSHSQSLCDDCKRRLSRNPLRILDCKNDDCKKVVDKAPEFPKFWCKDCDSHFSEVKRALKLADVNFELNHRIVRGLDYYMRTTFEFTTTKLGAQNAVLAGGRYDGLVKDLGGPEVPGIGFALGMERLVMLLAEVKAKAAGEDLIYFAVMGAKAIDAAVPVIQTLRKDGVRVEWDYGARSLKAQMRRAGKLNAESVVIIGDEEIAKGHAVIKNMRTGEQSEARLKDLPMHFVNIGG